MNIEVIKKNVEVIKKPGVWRFDVHVHGEKWGTASGSAGKGRTVEYTFNNIVGRAIRYPSTNKVCHVAVERKAETNVVLSGRVASLIQAGYWRPPAEAQAEFDKQQAADQAQKDAAAKEKRKAWEKRAKAAIKKMRGYVQTEFADPNSPPPEDVQAIIDAMEWAQVQ